MADSSNHRKGLGFVFFFQKEGQRRTRVQLQTCFGGKLVIPPPTHTHTHTYIHCTTNCSKANFFHKWSEIILWNVERLALSCAVFLLLLRSVSKAEVVQPICRGLFSPRYVPEGKTICKSMAPVFQVLDNTLVIVFADHGGRYTAARRTVQGKMEERLPMMSFALPEWFKKKYPKLFRNLEVNANR